MLLFHLKNRFQVLKGMSVKVSRKQSKNWLRRTNRQVSLNAKSWSYIDTVVNNHEATSNCFHFYRTIVIFSTLCFVGIFWNLARVFYKPLGSLWSLCFVLFFRQKNWKSQDPNIPKIQKHNICRKNKTRQQIRIYPSTTWQGLMKHVCQTSGSNQRQRRGHWTLKEFGAIGLNQLVLRIFKMATQGVY